MSNKKLIAFEQLKRVCKHTGRYYGGRGKATCHNPTHGNLTRFKDGDCLRWMYPCTKKLCPVFKRLEEPSK